MFTKTSGKKQILVTQSASDFMLPLLQQQGFTVTHTLKENLMPGYIDLDNFRSPLICHKGGDIREWYYQLLLQHLPKDFSRKLFEVRPNRHPQLKDKVILIKTPRYLNPFIDWKQLEAVKDNLVFMGLPVEHRNFCQEFFPVQYLEVEDGIDAAEKMVSAKGVVGNASGLYTLAECLKVPRILVSSEWTTSGKPGPNVVFPIGGWNQVVRINCRLLAAVKELLNKE